MGQVIGAATQARNNPEDARRVKVCMDRDPGLPASPVEEPLSALAYRNVFWTGSRSTDKGLDSPTAVEGEAPLASLSELDR